jgi:molybdopterin guanine dinucleotide-containing S/N-oxide reductase-like protein
MSKAEMDRMVPVSCDRDCGGGCPLAAYVSQGRIVRITDNPRTPELMRGCIKGYRMADTVYAKDRLKSPLIRTGERGGGHFREADWAEALDDIAKRLEAIRNRHGCLSLLPFSGSGSCRAAVHNTNFVGRRFFAMFGGFVNRTDSYSSAAAAFTDMHLFGTRMTGIDPLTLENSRMILLWGANLCETRFSSRIEAVIGRAKQRGVPVIVVDPRRTETVRKLSTCWIPILPGTDTAMLAAMLYVIVKEGCLAREFVERYTVGFDDLIAYVTGSLDGQAKSPAWASKICGVPEQTIIELARKYAAAKPAALLPGLSIQRTLGGEDTYRFTVALQAATGNIGIAGGSSGGEVWGKLPRIAFPSLPVPDTSMLPTVPVYRWADAVLEGRAGGYPSDIHAIYSIGGNYLNQGSDIKKNIGAFKKVDLVVTHDLFLTPTALFSDIVLPVTTSLEREDVIFPADHYLFYSHQAIEPLPVCRNDYDIFCDLADRLGFGADYSGGRTAAQWLEHLMAQSGIKDIERFRQTGILEGNEQRRVGLSRFIESPEQNPLSTPTGKIEIRCAALAETEASAIPQCRIAEPDSVYPLRMITPHSKFRINSQNSNLPWAAKLAKQVLVMNALDARSRGIQDGNRVRVQSPQGEMEIEASLTEDIIAGCVSLIQGAWTVRDAQGVEKGGSANILTSTIPTAPSQGARTHSIFVEVRLPGRESI